MDASIQSLIDMLACMIVEEEEEEEDEEVVAVVEDCWLNYVWNR